MSHEVVFSKVITSFIELFTDIVSTAHKNGYTTLNPEMIKIANMILSKKMLNLGPTNVINNFIYKSHEHWKYVAEKDEKYLLTALPEIITDVPKDYVNEFCKLLTTTKNKKSLIPEDDKNAFFENSTELIKISIRYIYKNRNPEIVNGKVEYKTKFFPEISLSTYSKLFGVKLN